MILVWNVIIIFLWYTVIHVRKSMLHRYREIHILCFINKCSVCIGNANVCNEPSINLSTAQLEEEKSN